MAGLGTGRRFAASASGSSPVTWEQGHPASQGCALDKETLHIEAAIVLDHDSDLAIELTKQVISEMSAWFLPPGHPATCLGGQMVSGEHPDPASLLGQISGYLQGQNCLEAKLHS